MAKYKVGDKVRIVKQQPDFCGFVDGMCQYLGKTLTVRNVYHYPKPAGYTFQEAYMEHDTVKRRWIFRENWIAGLAEPKKPEFSVSVHFHDRLTVAELIKDGKVVKVENSRCNPKGKYSMAEGARIAVERLFQKQVSTKPTIHIGEMLIVTGNSHRPHHHFPKGTIVTAIGLSGRGYINCHSAGGLLQTVSPLDLKPYKEK